MKYGKRMLTAGIAFLLLCSMVLPVNGASKFTDVPSGAWYEEAVTWCWENGIVNGTSATTFSPNGTMNRAMLATELYRAAGSPTVTGDVEFSDVGKGAYYENAIVWAAENQILFGYGGGRVGPTDPVTREQIVTILWRYSGSAATETSAAFADAADISGYAKQAVQWARANGIVDGVGNNRFAPKEAATRAQVAAILYRFLNKEKEDPKPSEPSEPTEPTEPTEPSEPTEPTEPEEPEKENMDIVIGTYRFTVVLEDNETAAALKEKLPLQLDMSELNGNEKYNYLPFTLPTNTYAPGQIQAGDVMLYGNNCLVVFYKSFSTPYSYTKIGHIEDITDLQKAVGTGSVQMTFTK